MYNFAKTILFLLPPAIVGCKSQDRPALPQYTDAGTATLKLEIGHDVELGRISWATRLDNGNIAVADAFAPGVLIFDSLGSLIRTIGRKGGGPGEFFDVAWIGQCEPGMLYALDAAQSEFEVFDTSGVSLRQVRVPPSSKMRCRDGIIAALLMPTDVRLPDPKQPRRMLSADLQVLNLDGEVTTTIKDLPVGELGPLARVADFALMEDGIWYGSADSTTLIHFSYKGRPVGSLTFAEHRRPTTDAHMQADIEAQVAGFTDEATKQRSRTILARFSKPDRLPAFRAFGADDRGNLWINDTFPGDSATTLLALSENGGSATRITLPGHVRVFEVRSGQIIGTVEADGVPVVVVYEVR